MRINVGDTFEQITSGSETSETVVRFGTGQVRFVLGDTASRDYDNAMPVSAGQMFIVPTGVELSAIMPTGKRGTVWKEEGFSA